MVLPLSDGRGRQKVHPIKEKVSRQENETSSE
jgi:hypothetical protein